MKINWCFKGIRESQAFDDRAADRALRRRGIQSSYMFNQSFLRVLARDCGHAALGDDALYRHVHDYERVRDRTPYISLSAGVRQFARAGLRPLTFGALITALDFATGGGACGGYVFSCWVVTSLKPVPEVPSLAEDIRDLNLFEEFSNYNHEGEVAAKLVVPARQVEWVAKVDAIGRLQPAWGVTSIRRNPAFVPPDRLSNVFAAIS